MKSPKELIDDLKEFDAQFSSEWPSLVALLLNDHRTMRGLIKTIRSPRTTLAKVVSSFNKLEKLVHSHMAGEESALLNQLKDHPKFKDEAMESWEEHRIHEHIFAGIRKLKLAERKVAQMKIYCEMLEHHLDEEEDDLFPDYQKYFGRRTRRRAAKKFVKRRLEKAGA